MILREGVSAKDSLNLSFLVVLTTLPHGLTLHSGGDLALVRLMKMIMNCKLTVDLDMGCGLE